ncbi:dynamin family protein, partial [Thalassobius sp. I31.1]|uniref:dynamin family protein n=1 Tax=Thalassobius sp. I31.1 TaxID=2109912 RepID=UPI001E28AE07
MMDQSELHSPTAPDVAEPAPKLVSPAAMQRLRSWSQRKPAIALMGEFSAGKSTLLNFLLRREVLPTQVTATQLPPVWLSYGTADPYIMYNDGTRAPVDLNRLDDIPVTGTRFLRIFMEADILEAMDLIDTPGISDPNIPPEVWRHAAGYANGVIWCTHATQAWRESERAAWVSLPERLRNTSLLLVTRADKLGEKDRQKVLRRVNREAGSLFAKSILFSALDAIRARDTAGSDDLWAKSGGEKFVDALFEATHDIIKNKKQKLKKYKPNQNTPGIQIAAQ